MSDNSLREVALAILTSCPGLSRRAGQFLGGLYAEPCQLSERQAEWIAALARKAGVEWEGLVNG